MNESVAGLRYQNVNGSSLISVIEEGKPERKVSIPELFMLISFKLSEAGQTQIKAQTEKMQVNNAVVAALNDKISQLSALQANVKPEENKRKPLSEWIGETKNPDYKNMVKQRNDNASGAEKYDEEARLWGVRPVRANQGTVPWTNYATLDELKQFTSVSAAHKFVENRLPKDEKGKPIWPDAMKRNIELLVQNWPRKQKHEEAIAWMETNIYGTIKPAFAGLGSFPTEALRDANGELLRDASGKIQLGGATMNLLENFGGKLHGNPIWDAEVNGADLDALITHLKGKIESYNSQSQLDMIDLQKFVSENNRYFDMASNMISKGAQSLQSIVGNIRG